MMNNMKLMKRNIIKFEKQILKIATMNLNQVRIHLIVMKKLMLMKKNKRELSIKLKQI